jgi:hypothetical protein
VPGARFAGTAAAAAVKDGASSGLSGSSLCGVYSVLSMHRAILVTVRCNRSRLLVRSGSGDCDSIIATVASIIILFMVTTPTAAPAPALVASCVGPHRR